jgi:hypothetical protein
MGLAIEEKQDLLDEFTQLTGYHRKISRRLCGSNCPSSPPGRLSASLLKSCSAQTVSSTLLSTLNESPACRVYIE